MADLVTQDCVDCIAGFVKSGALDLRIGSADQLVEHESTRCKASQLGPHLLCRYREVDQAAGNCALGHVGMMRTKPVGHLRECEPAALLDGLDAQCPVRVAAGQHHAGGQFAHVGRQCAEKEINGSALSSVRVLRMDVQPTILHGHNRVGRQKINSVDFDNRVIGNDAHRHCGEARHDLRQHAFTVGAQVGDDYARQSGLLRHAAKKTLQCLNPACGGAQAHNRKVRR
ncbi:hypothetical protein AWB74_08697 [Caballeronia arvi]|uniref:Uncharacterized protein n=1 Tax=Caballeronia arvi TaxID=1777135 RepID=A0A158L5Z5_9BURK|nr:hypothetical protein AWB74_08697 [Caballeronia arvi]